MGILPTATGPELYPAYELFVYSFIVATIFSVVIMVLLGALATAHSGKPYDVLLWACVVAMFGIMWVSAYYSGGGFWQIYIAFAALVIAPILAVVGGIRYFTATRAASAPAEAVEQSEGPSAESDLAD